MKVIVIFCYARGQMQDGIRNQDDNEKDETQARGIQIGSNVQVKSRHHYLSSGEKKQTKNNFNREPEFWATMIKW